MEYGTVLEWLVKPGATVKRGDIIAVVDTEKATIEVEVFEAGVVEAIVVPVGAKVPVGEILARIRGEGEIRTAQPMPAPAVPPAKPAPPRPVASR